MKTIGERLEEGWNYIGHDGAYDILKHVDDDMYLVATATSEYIVSPTSSGCLWECQCKDFEERGAKNGEGCKHIQLLDKTLRKQAELQETIDKDLKESADEGAKKMAADKKKGAKKKEDTEAQEKLDEKRKECDAIYGPMDKEIRDGKREELLHDIAKRLIDAKLFKEVYTDQLEKKLKNMYNAGLVTLIEKYDEVGWDKFCEVYKVEADKRPEQTKKKPEEPKPPPGPKLEGATFPETKELKVHKGKIEEKPAKKEVVVPEIVKEVNEELKKEATAMAIQGEIDTDLTHIDEAIEMREGLKTLYEGVMRKGSDYDTIPGTHKPTLLKPGAEILRTFCRLIPDMRLEAGTIEDWEKGFFNYNVKCTLTNSETGKIMGVCIGSCNSMEAKYRYRWEYVKHGQKAPEGAQTRKTKEGYEQYRAINDDPYTLVNTFQKMAEKRAFVGATLMATGASMIFTQDLEDMGDAIQAKQRR